MKKLAIALAAVTALGGGPAVAQDKADPAKVEKIIADMFATAPDAWKARVKQDETQAVCSKYRNDLPQAEFDKVLAREKATVKLPADGKVLGNWKAGEQIAQSGFGGRFNDKPETVNGGNCYACHQMAAAELSYGTLGPSLQHYGKIRKFAADEAKAVYAKIYNAQSVLPCSNMPRFGYHGFLSEQQIKDVVAYLFDPESPVNK